jgi:hypothetical protein
MGESHERRRGDRRWRRDRDAIGDIFSRLSLILCCAVMVVKKRGTYHLLDLKEGHLMSFRRTICERLPAAQITHFRRQTGQRQRRFRLKRESTPRTAEEDYEPNL